MIALVHYAGPYGTARMAQSTKNDLGLSQPASLPMAPAQIAMPHQMFQITQKIALCLKLIYRPVGFTTDCKGRGRSL